MLFIPQVQKDDCGFACLKMVLANINKDKNYLFLPQDESHGQYSYSEIIDIGKEYGVNFLPILVENKEEILKSKTFPFIATIKLKSGANHAVVVTKIKFNRITYLDPRKGKVTISLKKFYPMWDSTCLIIESFEKRKCEERGIDPIKTGSKVGLGLVQILSGVFAVLGVYFIKSDTPIYVPVIFLSLAIVSELVMRAISYSLMKNLDRFFFSDDNLPKDNFQEYLKRFEEYKKVSLSSPMNYILALIFSLGLIAVVLLNDYRNAMLVLLPIVLSIFDILAISPLLKNKKQEVEDLEVDLNNASDASDLKDKVQLMHNAAYNYSYIDVATRYIYAALIVVTALLTMHICGISSFPYIIFYTCISFSLYKAISSLFDFPERMEKFNIVKVKISNFLKSNR